MTDSTPGQISTAPAPGIDYRVELDAYAGPLDLLLYLVKRHEIDLNDVPVARLTEQYLKHLEVIRFLDMDQAGEFLVMAATLVEIKSAMLVPPEQQEAAEGAAAEGLEERTDPRMELVHQLLAYKRFKDAAIALEHRQDEWSSRFVIHPVKSSKAKIALGDVDPDNAPLAEIDLDDVHIMDLCEAFSRILDTIGTRKLQHEVTYDDTPISLHADDIYDRLARDGRLTLAKIFEGRTKRSEMIGLFLATLELAKQRKVKVVQDEATGELALERRADAEQLDLVARDDRATDWRDPHTGEMQYDWPDERAKRRFERRLRIRAEKSAQGHLADVPMINALDEEHGADSIADHDPLDEETEEDLLDDAA